MAHKTCPQCQTTLVTGFWEVFENCPSCGAVWSTDPELKAHMVSKLALVTLACALLAVIPVIGFFLGAAAVALGLVTMAKGKKGVGVMSIVLGGVFGVIGQPMLTYWGLGRMPERSCEASMQTVSDSLRAYRSLMNKYPAKLKDLKDAKLDAPEACPSDGGKFFYISPDDLAAAAAPAAMPPKTDADAAKPEPAATITTTAATTTTTTTTATTATTTAATASAPAAAVVKHIKLGNSRTLIAAEVYQAHRTHRTCMTSDLKVLSLTETQFNEMLDTPENRIFAAKLDGAYRAATRPADETKFHPWSPEQALAAYAVATQPAHESALRIWSPEQALAAMPAATQPTTKPAE